MKKLRNWYNCKIRNKHKVNVSDNRRQILGGVFKMGKVKITRDQEEIIRVWKEDLDNPSKLLELHAKNLLTDSKYLRSSALQSLTLNELARALYIDYEVEEEFKVGDKVVIKAGAGNVYTVVAIQVGICNLSGVVKLTNIKTSGIRHATSLERRMNEKLDNILLTLSDDERIKLAQKLDREWNE